MLLRQGGPARLNGKKQRSGVLVQNPVRAVILRSCLTLFQHVRCFPGSIIVSFSNPCDEAIYACTACNVPTVQRMKSSKDLLRLTFVSSQGQVLEKTDQRSRALQMHPASYLYVVNVLLKVPNKRTRAFKQLLKCTHSVVEVFSTGCFTHRMHR